MCVLFSQTLRWILLRGITYDVYLLLNSFCFRNKDKKKTNTRGGGDGELLWLWPNKNDDWDNECAGMGNRNGKTRKTNKREMWWDVDEDEDGGDNV